MHLQDIGLLSCVDRGGLSRTYASILTDSYQRVFISHNKAIMIKHEDVNKEATSQNYLLTGIGIQVFALASVSAQDEYMLSIAKDYAKQGYNVQIADWKQVTASQGQAYNTKVVEA